MTSGRFWLYGDCYIQQTIGNDLGPWPFVCIVEVSVIQGACCIYLYVTLIASGHLQIHPLYGVRIIAEHCELVHV